VKYEHYVKNYVQNVLAETDTMPFGCFSLSADTCNTNFWRVYVFLS